MVEFSTVGLVEQEPVGTRDRQRDANHRDTEVVHALDHLSQQALVVDDLCGQQAVSRQAASALGIIGGPPQVVQELHFTCIAPEQQGLDTGQRR